MLLGLDFYNKIFGFFFSFSDVIVTQVVVISFVTIAVLWQCCG